MTPPADEALPSTTGRLTEADREALCERAAQARAAASAAIDRYVLLLAQARHHLKVTEQQLVAIDATRAILYESMQRYARLLRALDTPPERMLSLVKETVRQQLPQPAGEEEMKALFEKVVTWCIEAYYSTSPAA